MRFHSPEDTFTDSAAAYAETEKIIESISDRMQKDRDYVYSVRAAERIVSCSCDDHKK